MCVAGVHVCLLSALLSATLLLVLLRLVSYVVRVDTLCAYADTLLLLCVACLLSLLLPCTLLLLLALLLRSCALVECGEVYLAEDIECLLRTLVALQAERLLCLCLVVAVGCHGSLVIGFLCVLLIGFLGLPGLCFGCLLNCHLRLFLYCGSLHFRSLGRSLLGLCLQFLWGHGLFDVLGGFLLNRLLCLHRLLLWCLALGFRGLSWSVKLVEVYFPDWFVLLSCRLFCHCGLCLFLFLSCTGVSGLRGFVCSLYVYRRLLGLDLLCQLLGL